MSLITIRYLLMAYLLTCQLTSMGQDIVLIPYANNFVKPVDISHAGIAGDLRLFITEKDGRIKIVLPDKSVLPVPFLDIDSRVNSSANERGLLGLCFHPDYETNGYFYVHYSNAGGHSTISRFKVSNNPDIAEVDSEKILLVVNQPFNNHNAGDLEFGPDGYLYIGMGDGGSGGDPGDRSQNPKNLLGKMLRIDVNTETENYLIPSDNPFKNNVDTLPEIWALGLRNPWRFSFDTVNNEIWIADVGQDKWEEINVAQIDQAALNYGWRCYEGDKIFNFSNCQTSTRFHFPAHVYVNSFDVGCSVTGGYIYRGNKYPAMSGKYVYADFCTGIFTVLARDTSGKWSPEHATDLDNMEFATFGTDINGELYVAGLANGTVFQVTSEGVNGTGQQQSESGFAVTPNPTENRLFVTFTDAKYISGTWQIFSVNDKVIFPQSIQASENETILDTETLPAGVYVLKNSHSSHICTFLKM